MLILAPSLRCSYVAAARRPAQSLLDRNNIHRRHYALVVAGCATFLLALMASQTWEPSQVAPNVLIQQQLQRQRGAAFGARSGNFEPRVGQRLANVEVDTFGRQRDSQHTISQSEPLVTAKTMREAMADLKGKPIGSGATLKIAEGQQLRYTGR